MRVVRARSRFGSGASSEVELVYFVAITIIKDVRKCVPQIGAAQPELRRTPRFASNVPRVVSNVPRILSNVPRIASNVPRAASIVPRIASYVPRIASDVPRTALNVRKQRCSCC